MKAQTDTAPTKNKAPRKVEPRTNAKPKQKDYLRTERRLVRDTNCWEYENCIIDTRFSGLYQ